MLNKPCIQCQGKGHLVEEKKNEEGDIIVEKKPCESCNGTGTAFFHLLNTYNRQLQDIQKHQNQILHELRKKRLEVFSDFKKTN
jgi:hypothetical protein